ncbi:PolC-type DNA polymerase III [Mycoplasmopsis pullorum]|uniref:PolC-type DNA polymerase III n=4 Tax=Mycoplasmopsis pullorum TaxID=48003 RepID=UPI001119E883|nr:PolC-type DNA polymerase III [Mycoplasmopsis pullorum]TNK83519.1 PolC-type DNA polymerase III [Mycoplasmopsis pullorum]TNK84923.1 PolC-type DNA polymerase III [Mycoplasmopsis pullorum]TNK85522.1 PolC-type DNA polymerase III [Mycoplasmopsis pullorum]TNK85715.1 PolC-type DNA polymerase III [Mycoplasmopsis pullorum]TNK86913.1 PolC-type DNA polymerase III [Mycoplasmopsis pullorum]
MSSKKYSYNDQNFSNFAQNIDLPFLESFTSIIMKEEMEIEEKDGQNYYHVDYIFDEKGMPTPSDLFAFLNFISSKNPQIVPHISFKTDSNVSVSSLPITKDFIIYLFNFSKIFKDALVESELFYSDESQNWTFVTNISNFKDIDKFVAKISKMLRNSGFVDFSMSVEQKNLQTIEEISSIEMNKDIDFLKHLQQSKNENELKEKIAQNKWDFRSRKSKEYINLEISKINEEVEIPNNFFVNTKGLIFKNDYTVTQKGFHIYTYSITDHTDAIEIKHFFREPNPDGLIPVGKYIEVFGTVNKNYNNAKQIYADSIVITDGDVQTREDNANLKRVELSVRSKMNTMDGLLKPEEIVLAAKKFGHNAVALVDSDGVQGFPEFYSSSKKQGVKPIYGVSFKTTFENLGTVTSNFPNSTLRDYDYVAFDIETTGLSPKVHEIIEFGAVFIKDNEIINKEQFFIKAQKPLSAFTYELTKINDELLEKEGISLDKGLKRIYEILNNNVAIAHNVSFDKNFIFEKFNQNNIPLPNTTFLDTLMVSRILFPYKRSHSLGSFCQNLGIDYNENEAHRADYDAEVLGKVWRASLSQLSNININTFEDLYNYKSPESYSKWSLKEVTVIALNQKGLKELFDLVTLAQTTRYYNTPKLFFSDLKKSPNLLIGSGALKGHLIDALLYLSEQELDSLMPFFDYIEIPPVQDFNHKIEYGDFTKVEIENLLLHLYKKAVQWNKIPVAVGDVRYVDEKDQILHKILVHSKGIGNEVHYLFERKRKNNIRIPMQNYLTTEEMKQQFSFLPSSKIIEDVVVNNTNKIADMVEEIEVIKKDLYTPVFDNSKQNLHDLVYKTAHEKYGENLPTIVKERIEKELTPILKYGFDVVYWISHKLVKKSVDNGYLVGSRGSVGSSLVATLSGITEVNPLEPHYICPKCKHFELANIPSIKSGFDLDDKNCPNCVDVIMDKDGQTIPFETFLGFNADKVPDIDLNFSGEYQSTIHAEVRRLFGEKHTFRAGTISTVAAKTAYRFVKEMVEEQKWKISDSFVEYLASKIEGVKRTTGQHPGGIIIIPKEFDVEDFTPVNFPAEEPSSDWKTTHFDFHAIHDNVLKLDILGHVDPTAIRMLENLTGINVKKDIPKKDPKVMSIFTSTEALGVKPEDIGGDKTGALGIPEFGTQFVRKMLQEANAQSFADLVSLSGLSHGENVWLNNAQSLIKEKNFSLKDVICCRDDIMDYLINKGIDPLFSFKIMEQVRKGKGISAEQEEELVKNSVPDWYIDSMKKIKYMFPKAHATAYVLMAWRIAWFKVYYPLEYYATYLTTRIENFEIATMINDDKKATKIQQRIKEILDKDMKDRTTKENKLIPCFEIARELYARGFSISNIDLHRSLDTQWVVDREAKKLIPPFSTIDGLGISVAKSIVDARNEREFISVNDFKKRTLVNNTQMKSLRDLGVFEQVNETDQLILFNV